MRISEYQAALIDRLKDAGILAGPPAIPVFSHVDGAQTAEREQALASVGMCVYVAMPRIAPFGQVASDHQLGYTFAVMIYDNPPLRTRKDEDGKQVGPSITGVDLAWDVFGALSGWSPAANRTIGNIAPDMPIDRLDGSTPLGQTSQLSLVEISNVAQSPHVIWSVTLRATECYSIVS